MSLKSRRSDIVIQDSDNETLVYDLLTNKAYLLNETASFVWKSLDGATDTKTIAINLAKKTKTQPSEDLVWLTVEYLKKDNLLEQSQTIKTPLEALKRREVIKRIGLATMVALPIVSSLVAPTAANAASGICESLSTGGCYTGSVVLCGPGGCPTVLNGKTITYDIYTTATCSPPTASTGNTITCSNLISSYTVSLFSGYSLKITSIT